MSFFDKLKDALVPQTEKGVRLECANCGATLDADDPPATCPECGSDEIIEDEAFEMRPQE